MPINAEEQEQMRHPVCSHFTTSPTDPYQRVHCCGQVTQKIIIQYRGFNYNEFLSCDRHAQELERHQHEIILDDRLGFEAQVQVEVV